MTVDQRNTFNLTMIPGLILSGLMAFLLCSSGLFSILSPMPLVTAGIRYGKQMLYPLGVLTLIVTYFLFKGKDGSFFLIGMLCLYVVISFLICEIIDRKISPAKGMIGAGLLTLLISFGSIFAFLSDKGKTPKEFFVDKVVANQKSYSSMVGLFYEKDSLEYKSFVQKIEKEPGVFADEVIPVIPKVLIVLSFITVWINLCLGFKNRFLRGSRREELEKLINFKVPDHFVWLFIAGLGFVVFGEYLGAVVPEVGSYILTVLSIFYFFQGFGIYVSFLDSLKVFGFFRMLLIVSTVYMAFQILILIGFTDLFVNFRRFFKKNNNEGEL